MRVEELVGRRIRAERERLGLTQGQLGEKLGEKLGRSWPRQAVSAAEQGNRAFTVAELLALAFTLGLSVGGMLMPPSGVDDVEMPNGTTFSREELVAAVLPRLDTERTFDRMQMTLGILTRYFDGIRDFARLAGIEVELLNDEVLLAQSVLT